MCVFITKHYLICTLCPGFQFITAQYWTTWDQFTSGKIHVIVALM